MSILAASWTKIDMIVIAHHITTRIRSMNIYIRSAVFDRHFLRNIKLKFNRETNEKLLFTSMTLSGNFLVRYPDMQEHCMRVDCVVSGLAFERVNQVKLKKNKMVANPKQLSYGVKLLERKNFSWTIFFEKNSWEYTKSLHISSKSIIWFKTDRFPAITQLLSPNFFLPFIENKWSCRKWRGLVNKTRVWVA